MKSNPFLRGVNVAPPEPTRAPAPPKSGEPSAPDLSAVVGRCAYQRDLRAIARRANELRDALDAFAEYTPASVSAELLAGGLSPADLSSGLVCGYLDAVDCMTADARGFLWALDMFVGVAEGDLLPALGDDSVPEVRPDAIRTGKGGAR